MPFCIKICRLCGQDTDIDAAARRVLNKRVHGLICSHGCSADAGFTTVMVQDDGRFSLEIRCCHWGCKKTVYPCNASFVERVEGVVYVACEEHVEHCREMARQSLYYS